jgi:hypothetical protein
LHPTPAKAECDERKILEGRALADRKVYLSVVAELGDHLSTQVFREAYERADRARNSYESARDALEIHLEVHECGLP